jgi:hypothetical protein
MFYVRDPDLIRTGTERTPAAQPSCIVFFLAAGSTGSPPEQRDAAYNIERFPIPHHCEGGKYNL